MDKLVDSAVDNILAFIIGGVLTFAMTKYRDYRKSNKILIKIFAFNPKKTSRLCYGNIQNDTQYISPLSNDLPEKKFDYGDITAILEVTNTFNLLLKNIETIPNNIPQELFKGNILSVGGPKWNKKTEELIGVMGSPFYFKEGKACLLEKRRSHVQETSLDFKIEHLEDGNVEITDYGIILCHKKLGSTLDSCVVIAGYSTFGVLFAANALKEVQKAEYSKLRSSTNDVEKFALYVKGSIILNSKGHIIREAKLGKINWISEQDFQDPYHYSY